MAEKTEQGSLSAKEGVVTSSSSTIDSSQQDSHAEWTVEEETAIRRKFDYVVTPLCTVLYLCCAVDR